MAGWSGVSNGEVSRPGAAVGLTTHPAPGRLVAHARGQSPNGGVEALHRRAMVGCVIGKGSSIKATADRFQVDTKTVR